jgi:hypothetical protein
VRLAWLPALGLLGCLLAALVQSVCRLGLLWGVATAEDPWMHLPDRTLELVEALSAVAGLGSFVVTAALWLVWEGRAYAAMVKLPRASWSAGVGAVIGFWFVPVANAVVPLRHLEELWCNLAPEEERPEAEAPGLLRTWWWAWIGAWVLLGAALWLGESQSSLVVPNAVLDVLVTCARATAATLAAVVLLRLDARLAAATG